MSAAPFLVTTLLLVCGPPDEPVSELPVETILQSTCLLSILSEVNLSAAHAGVLASLTKRDGQAVNKGDLVARIRSRDAKLAEQIATLELALAKSQAENVTRIEAAEKAAAVAHQELSIHLKSNSSLLETTRARLNAEHADLQVDLAKRELAEAKLTAQAREKQAVVANNQTADCDILAPIDGVVAEVLRHEGEWAQQGEPIVRIIRMDRFPL